MSMSMSITVQFDVWIILILNIEYYVLHIHIPTLSTAGECRTVTR